MAQGQDFYELDGPENRRLILDEDECGAAYAYLVEDEIAGDVWLYNVRPADAVRKRIRDVASIKVVWRVDGVVELFFDERLEARLWRGGRPGQSYMAVADGPLAMRLPAE